MWSERLRCQLERTTGRTEFGRSAADLHQGTDRGRRRLAPHLDVCADQRWGGPQSHEELCGTSALDRRSSLPWRRDSCATPTQLPGCCQPIP